MLVRSLLFVVISIHCNLALVAAQQAGALDPSILWDEEGEGNPLPAEFAGK